MAKIQGACKKQVIMSSMYEVMRATNGEVVAVMKRNKEEKEENSVSDKVTLTEIKAFRYFAGQISCISQDMDGYIVGPGTLTPYDQA